MQKMLALLTDIVKGEVTGSPFSLTPLSHDEAKELFRLAKRHELAHIVGNAVCREGILSDNTARAAFEKEAFTALYRYEVMEKELFSLSALFEKEKLPFMPLKGAVLRAWYPSPWMRNSCDIDVLVKQSELPRAKNVLLENGYLLAGGGTHDVAFNSPAGVHIELHYTLIEDGALQGAAAAMGDPWEHAHPIRDGAYRYEMTDAAFYLYHIAHMAKHYLLGGCGIRPFLDLWVLEHLVPHDNAARIALLEGGSLATFAQAAKALSNVWFGDGAYSPLLTEMEHFVLLGGVYGNIENRVSLQQAKRGGKLRYIISRVFIPFENLACYYPSLKKHKWLLPFCHVRRWFRLVFLGRFKHSVHELHLNAAQSSSLIQSTKKHLEALGL